MLEIVIDIETTGLDPLDGVRVVEIGAVELIDHSTTNQTFHRYVRVLQSVGLQFADGREPAITPLSRALADGLGQR
jgi:DNA polymerase III epsilon subunit-like protein